MYYAENTERDLHNSLILSSNFVNSLPQPEPQQSPPPSEEKVQEESPKEESKSLSVDEYHIEFHLGYRTYKKHSIIENADFFRDGPKVNNITARKKCDAMIKDALYTFADFIQANQENHVDHELPPFPSKAFFDRVEELTVECLIKYKLCVDSFRLFDTLHERVKQLPGCMHVPFSYLSYIPPEFANNSQFWKRCDKKKLEEHLEKRALGEE